MVIVKKRKLTKYDVFFAERPVFKNWLITYYMQAKSTSYFLGFKRTPKFTKLIHLSNLDYSSKFDKNTSYEIRRAMKEGISCEITKDIESFVSFYNNFIIDKGLIKTINALEMSCYKDALLLSVAKKNANEIIVYHSYLIDATLKRVRLLHSASKIHGINEVSAERALTGRANRLLHFWDMEFFRKQGYKLYDFGGYAFGTNDSSLLGINKFKDNFGGELVEESIYEAFPIYLLKYLFNYFKK